MDFDLRSRCRSIPANGGKVRHSSHTRSISADGGKRWQPSRIQALVRGISTFGNRTRAAKVARGQGRPVPSASSGQRAMLPFMCQDCPLTARDVWPADISINGGRCHRNLPPRKQRPRRSGVSRSAPRTGGTLMKKNNDPFHQGSIPAHAGELRNHVWSEFPDLGLSPRTRGNTVRMTISFSSTTVYLRARRELSSTTPDPAKSQPKRGLQVRLPA